MPGAYAYTPAIWPPLATAIFLAAIGLYSWRRREVPAALPLAGVSLFGALWALGIALEAAAVVPATKVAWFRFQSVWRAPVAAADLCFVLEYAYPGRWLSRRNLTLLSLPALLDILLIVTGGSQLMWRRLAVGPDGSVVADLAPAGMVMAAFWVGLVLLNAAVLVWLFVRSSEQRSPATLILFGEIGSRALYMVDAAHLPWSASFDPTVLAIFLGYAAYSVALFAFHIFDPLQMARRAVIEQMQAGVVVFDPAWRVLGLNPSAERVLGISAAAARTKTWRQIAPPAALLPELLHGGAQPGSGPADLPEITIGSSPTARHYAPSVTPLKDFRGLLMGHLLLLGEVTEQRRAQAQILEQQRASAMLKERERLARELHDELGQVLGYVTVQARAARDQVDRDQKETAHDYLTQLIAAAQEAHTDVRDYILGARLTADPNFNFFLALEQYLRRFTANYRIRAELVAPPELSSEAFDPVVQVQLFRIIQEALTNVRKHASAQCVQVRIERASGRAQVMIQDDGDGFDPQPGAGDGEHFGLSFMRERAQEMGGSLTLTSGTGRGTQVIVEAPLRG